jgi:tRNA pseudouridine38-40 synthase
MHYYRVTIAYKGTHYCGWQAQSTDTLHEERPTVEGTILNALKRITNYQPCTISAASRTDGGVHAQGQTAKITILDEISPESLLSGLNSLLPVDIRILKCGPSTKDYQPNRSSVSKEYHYYFAASPVDNVATSDIALHLPIKNIEPDNLALLRTACQVVWLNVFNRKMQGNIGGGYIFNRRGCKVIVVFLANTTSIWLIVFC